MSSPSLPNVYPVDLRGPAIDKYAEGNTGIPYVWSFEAARPGPHVLVSAIVHGNEPAGAVALDWVLRETVRPVSGTLTLAFMNVEGYRRFDAADPFASRWVDEDFNRLWDEAVLDGERDSLELRRARAVRPVVAAADYLLDIHTMQNPAPPLMMAGWPDKGVALARKVGVPPLIVVDKGHAAGRRMRDYGGFSDPADRKTALLVECGQHWAAPAGDLAIETMLRFLSALGTIDPAVARAAGHDGQTAPQDVWEVVEAVTIRSDAFRFARPFTGGEILKARGTPIGQDGDDPVATPHDECMLVMPTRRLWKGQTAVRLARRR